MKCKHCGKQIVLRAGKGAKTNGRGQRRRHSLIQHLQQNHPQVVTWSGFTHAKGFHAEEHVEAE